MALEHKDRVADTTTTTGTGTVTLAGTAPAGYRTFASAGLTTGATVRYSLASADQTEWEVGEGVWTSSGATLSRVTVYASSNANALVSFSAGTKNVALVAVAKDIDDLTTSFDKISVRNATGGSSASNAFGKVLHDTVDYDTNSIWDSTNKRIVPKKAGYYLVTHQVRTTSGPTSMLAAVRKNGSTTYFVGAYAVSQLSCGGTVLVYCNGSTDYLEGFAYTSSSVTFGSTAGEQFLQAHGPL